MPQVTIEILIYALAGVIIFNLLLGCMILLLWRKVKILRLKTGDTIVVSQKTAEGFVPQEWIVYEVDTAHTHRTLSLADYSPAENAKIISLLDMVNNPEFPESKKFMENLKFQNPQVFTRLNELLEDKRSLTDEKWNLLTQLSQASRFRRISEISIETELEKVKRDRQKLKKLLEKSYEKLDHTVLSDLERAQVIELEQEILKILREIA